MKKYQDEVGVFLDDGNGDASLVAIGRQNQRVERIVRVFRFANSDFSI